VTFYKIKDKTFILSFPLEFELFLKATKYGGFGININADLNSTMKMVSLGARFGFGKMK
jgi:hypothetical protein